MQTQRALIAKWRDAYFQPECAPSTQWIKNMIQQGVYSGEKIGGAWYIHVHTGTIEPVKPHEAPPRTDREKITNTGNALADAMLDDWLQVG